MSLSFKFLRAIAPASCAALVILLLAFSTPAAVEAQAGQDTTKARAKPSAQQFEQPSPQMMQQQAEMMAPMMEHMMQAMMEGSLIVLGKPETAERIATFTKNYYDALLRKGFSNENALKIVMAHGIPALPTGR